MPFLIVALCYGVAIALSLYLVWHFGVRHWYLHLLSLVLAIAIGVVPLSPRFNDPGGTVLIGSVFLFLFFWGVSAPVVVAMRHPPRWLRRH
jgi:hypothetical protein